MTILDGPSETTTAPSNSPSTTATEEPVKKKRKRLPHPSDGRREQRNTTERPLDFDKAAFPLPKYKLELMRLQQAVKHAQEEVDMLETAFESSFESKLTAPEAIAAFKESQREFNQKIVSVYPTIKDFIRRDGHDRSKMLLATVPAPLLSAKGSTSIKQGTGYYMIRHDCMVSSLTLAAVKSAQVGNGRLAPKVARTKLGFWAEEVRNITSEQKKANRKSVNFTTRSSAVMTSIHDKLTTDVLQFVDGFAYCAVCDHAWIGSSPFGKKEMGTRGRSICSRREHG